MKFKRIVCMLLMTLLVSSCKITHDLALSKKSTTDEIILTEVAPEVNNTPDAPEKSAELPSEIAGHPVVYTEGNGTDVKEVQPAAIETNKTNWWLIVLITLPPLLILLYVINKKVAKKLNENVN